VAACPQNFLPGCLNLLTSFFQITRKFFYWVNGEGGREGRDDNFSFAKKT
jgi:hypothetical protein